MHPATRLEIGATEAPETKTPDPQIAKKEEIP
jgi:hypothetical protein